VQSSDEGWWSLPGARSTWPAPSRQFGLSGFTRLLKNICLWAVSRRFWDHVDSGACKANGEGDFGQVDRSPMEPLRAA